MHCEESMPEWWRDGLWKRVFCWAWPLLLPFMAPAVHLLLKQLLEEVLSVWRRWRRAPKEGSAPPKPLCVLASQVGFNTEAQGNTLEAFFEWWALLLGICSCNLSSHRALWKGSLKSKHPEVLCGFWDPCLVESTDEHSPHSKYLMAFLANAVSKARQNRWRPRPYWSESCAIRGTTTCNALFLEPSQVIHEINFSKNLGQQHFHTTCDFWVQFFIFMFNPDKGCFVTMLHKSSK